MLFRSVLADFVADFAPNATQQAEKELLNLIERSDSKWTLIVDGSSNTNGAGIGLVLTSPEGDLIQQAIRCGFKATNNEAVIPVECGIPSARYMWLDKDSNRDLLNHSLDAIDELRDKAHLRTALYQQKVAQHYNKNIRVRTFKIGDWVLRRVFQNTKETENPAAPNQMNLSSDA